MDIHQVKADFDNDVIISKVTIGKVIERCLELERAVTPNAGFSYSEKRTPGSSEIGTQEFYGLLLEVAIAARAGRSNIRQTEALVAHIDARIAEARQQGFTSAVNLIEAQGA